MKLNISAAGGETLGLAGAGRDKSPNRAAVLGLSARQMRVTEYQTGGALSRD